MRLDNIGHLIVSLEANAGHRWKSILQNLLSADLSQDQKDLGVDVVTAGLVIATNLLSALKGSSVGVPFTPDPLVIEQYSRSLRVEEGRLKKWRSAAGKRPVSPVRIALEMFEEQLLSLRGLNGLIASSADQHAHRGKPLAQGAQPAAVREVHAAPADPDHVVLIVHGIRTEAEWEELVANVLHKTGLVLAQPFRYGYFDLLQFLTPGSWTRHKPIDRLHRELRELSRRYPRAKMTVIAHSFGTYAICSILEDFRDLNLHRLILCGSVVPLDFRWDRVRDQVQCRIINECGVSDIWPRLAQSCTWGYGASGSVGFGAAGVKDRFHRGTHSDFFSEQFVTVHWLPLVLYGDTPESFQVRARTPLVHRLISRFPVRWLTASSIAAAVIIEVGFSLVGFLQWWRGD
jgi:pimeloyl-ACP methyl ester carboxylesterase